MTDEETTTFEVSLQRQLNEMLDFDVTGYYKDVQGLVATRTLKSERYQPTIYVNSDYGTIRGAEIGFYQKPFRILKGLPLTISDTLVLSYMVARGVSSSTAQGYQVHLGNLAAVPTGEHPLSWDQRIALDASFILRYHDWTVANDIGWATGLPYTPVYRYQKNQNPSNINSKRLPPTFTWDVRLTKGISFGDEQWKKFNFYILVSNLTNETNISSIAPFVWPRGGSNDYYIHYTETGHQGGGYGLHQYEDPRVWAR